MKKIARYCVIGMLLTLTSAYVLAIPLLIFGAAVGSMEQGDPPISAFPLMLGVPALVLAILWGIGLFGLRLLKARA